MAEGQFQDPRESRTDSEPEPAVPEYLLPGPASAGPASPRPARPEPHVGDWTVADVQDARFSTTRLRPGYDEEEVDIFLTRAEAELARLISQRDDGGPGHAGF